MAEFQPKTAKHLWRLSFEGAWPTSVAFLGSNRLAAGNRDGQILLWDLTEPPPETVDDDKTQDAKTQNAKTQEGEAAADVAPRRQLQGHTNGISRLVTTADGKRLISASLDRTLRVWDIDVPGSGETQVVVDRKSREQKAKRLPQAERQAFIDAPGVTVESQTAVRVLNGHKDWVNALGISRDGKRLISGDARSTVIVWEIAGGQPVSSWTGHAWNGIVAAGLSPDGQSAVVSEFTYKRDDFDLPAPALKVWNVGDASEKLDILKTHIPKLDATKTSYGAASVWRKFVKGGLIALDYAPDGSLVAAGQGGETDKGQLHLFDVETGKLVRTMSGHRYGMCDAKFSDDGKYVLTSGRDTTIRICQVADGKEVAVLGKERGGQFKDWLHGLAISADQTRVAAADIGGAVHVWELSG